MSCDVVIELVDGDLLPYLAVTWENQVITGWDIKLHVRLEDGTKYTRTAIIDDDGTTTGDSQFHFEWQSGDLVQGRHEAEIEAFNTSSENETWKGIVLDIDEDIA